MTLLALTITATSPAGEPKTSVAFYSAKCGDAWTAVRWYRARYDQHRTLMHLPLAPPVEQAMNCRRLRERARYWVQAARTNRRALTRWRNRTPVGEAAIRAMINDDCLEEIVRRETAGTWSPTVYNYQGSGAYGLPQALPGHKMASAGADWQTNPRTQIAWMRSYVNARYGGSCNALAHHNSQGWY